MAGGPRGAAAFAPAGRWLRSPTVNDLVWTKGSGFILPGRTTGPSPHELIRRQGLQPLEEAIEVPRRGRGAEVIS